LRAVEDVDDGLAGFLAGEVGEDERGDVGVGDEAVDGAGAGVVDYDLGVGALGCDGDDEVVGCWVGLGGGLVSKEIHWSCILAFWTHDVGAVPAFGGELVDEDEADF